MSCNFVRINSRWSICWCVATHRLKGIKDYWAVSSNKEAASRQARCGRRSSMTPTHRRTPPMREANNEMRDNQRWTSRATNNLLQEKRKLSCVNRVGGEWRTSLSLRSAALRRSISPSVICLARSKCLLVLMWSWRSCSSHSHSLRAHYQQHWLTTHYSLTVLALADV